MFANPKTILLTNWLALCTACAAPPSSIPVSETAADGRYIHYSLPRTVILITGTALKSTTKKPICADLTNVAIGKTPEAKSVRDLFREARLDPSKLPVDKTTKFGVSGTSLLTFAEPDPANVYAIEVRAIPAKKNQVAITLSKFGLLTDGSVGSTDFTLETVTDASVKLISVGAKVAAAAIGAGGAGSQRTYCDKLLAELVQIEQQRFDLVTGGGEEDISGLLAGLDTQRKLILPAFAGVPNLEKAPFTCFARPTPSAPGTGLEVSRTRILELNKNEGLKLSRGCVGAGGFATQAAGEDFDLVLTPPPGRLAAEHIGDSVTRIGRVKTAVHTRIPVPVWAHVESEGIAVTTPTSIAVAQFGPVVPIPLPAKRTRAVQVSFGLHSDSGSLKKVDYTLGTKPSVPGFDPIGDSAASVIKASEEQRKANTPDPAAELDDDVKLKLLQRCDAGLDEGKVDAACDLL